MGTKHLENKLKASSFKYPRFCPKCGTRLAIMTGEAMDEYDPDDGRKLKTKYIVTILCPRTTCSLVNCIWGFCSEFKRIIPDLSRKKLGFFKREYKEIFID